MAIYCAIFSEGSVSHFQFCIQTCFVSLRLISLLFRLLQLQSLGFELLIDLIKSQVRISPFPMVGFHVCQARMWSVTLSLSDQCSRLVVARVCLPTLHVHQHALRRLMMKDTLLEGILIEEDLGSISLSLLLRSGSLMR